MLSADVDARELTAPQRVVRAAVVSALVVGLALTAAPSKGWSRVAGHAALARASAYAFPLKVSSNRRYLVDQRGKPFLVVGDSPQALIGNLSLKDAAAYIADRKAAGFNALIVDVLCAKYTGCRDDGTTADGIQPFRVGGDLATPNPAYFARVDDVVRLAARAGIVLFLDPIETGGWLDVLRENGPQNDYAYGRFLGERYKRFGNVAWSNGNDFQSWRNRSDDALALAVAKGIESADPRYLQTVELNYLRSASFDDPRWRSVASIDSAYTYFPTYAEVREEYDRRRFMPVVMIEAGYEFEQNIPSISYGSPLTLRRQEYWSLLAGAAGQFYGNHYTWQFSDGWKEHLDTVGSRQIGYLVRLFAAHPWYRLVPDEGHALVTSGYGRPTTQGNVDSSDYVTAAATAAGDFAVAYLPAGGTVTVDVSRLRRPVRASWYDPTTGVYRRAHPRLLTRAARVRFASPGRNGDGDLDWLLVMTHA